MTDRPGSGGKKGKPRTPHPLGDDPPGRFLRQLRELYEGNGQPTRDAMAKNAANRRDPVTLEALLGESAQDFVTTGRRMSDLISGHRLPTDAELVDLLLGVPPAGPTPRGEIQEWLDDLRRVRDDPARRRRLPGLRWIIAASVAVVVVVAVVAIVVVTSSGSSAHHQADAIIEVVGDSQGSVRTWSNPLDAGGTPGIALPEGARQPVICRRTGFVVSDGDQWWYKLGGDYHGRFYSTADGFYNTIGRTSGNLKGTPPVDAAVPVCSS